MWQFSILENGAVAVGLKSKYDSTIGISECPSKITCQNITQILSSIFKRGTKQSKFSWTKALLDLFIYVQAKRFNNKKLRGLSIPPQCDQKTEAYTQTLLKK